MPSLMVSCVRRFTCSHRPGIPFHMALYAVFVSLYGLKQAPRACFEHFASVVTAASFSASAPDSAMFVHHSSRSRLFFYI